jgi:hypothetical protein
MINLSNTPNWNIQRNPCADVGDRKVELHPVGASAGVGSSLLDLV